VGGTPAGVGGSRSKWEVLQQEWVDLGLSGIFVHSSHNFMAGAVRLLSSFVAGG